MKCWTQQGGGAHCLTLRDQPQNCQESPLLLGECPLLGFIPSSLLWYMRPCSWMEKLPTLIPSSEGNKRRLWFGRYLFNYKMPHRGKGPSFLLSFPCAGDTCLPHSVTTENPRLLKERRKASFSISFWMTAAPERNQPIFMIHMQKCVIHT